MDQLSVMLGEMKSMLTQTLETVRDMSDRLRQTEGTQAGHEARITAIEGFVRQHQDADSREKPTLFSATQLAVSIVAVGVTLVLGIFAVTLQ